MPRPHKLPEYCEFPPYKGEYTVLSTYGYIYDYLPSHPGCTKKGYVMQHRLVMEEYLGRYLDKDEIVHHIDEIRDNNFIENLEL